MTDEFTGKVVLVSGGAQGVSGVILRRFAAEGARAVIVDIDDERAQAALDDLRSRGRDVGFIHTDVRDGWKELPHLANAGDNHRIM